MNSLVFPRWQFPYNLGDSIVSTFIPKIINKITGNKITDESLGSIFKNDPNVENVYTKVSSNDDNILVFPVWHDRVFSFWKEFDKKLFNHPTANIITVNYCLQIGIEKYLIDSNYNLDFSPKIYGILKSKNSKLHLGICPATKLSGKQTPHPNCDGIGYRFNGPKGFDSWKTLVSYIKSKIECVVVELSPAYLGLGDIHIGMCDNLYDLAKKVSIIDFAVTTDGGYHHLLNALEIPLVIFNGSKISKSEFLKLRNSFFPEHLHLKCRFKCPSYFTEVYGGEDASKSCSLECENLDPVKLAEYCVEKIKCTIL
jgi:hypothetical protein